MTDAFSDLIPNNSSPVSPRQENPFSDLVGNPFTDLISAETESPDYNLARGVVARGSQLLGNLLGAGGAAARKLEKKFPVGGLGIYDEYPFVKYLSQEELESERKKHGLKEPLTQAGEYWNEKDFGYVPEHTWNKLKKAFGEKGALSGSSWSEVMKYATEQGIKSIPDMVAVFAALTAYITLRSGEIGTTRAENKGKKEVELEDMIEAAPAAVGSAILERFGAKGITVDVIENVGKEAIKSGVKNVAKAAGKGAGKEAITEFLQEGIVEYVGEKYGTGAKMQFSEAMERGFAGAVAGGVYGGATSATVGGVSQVLKKGPQVETEGASDAYPESTDINRYSTEYRYDEKTTALYKFFKEYNEYLFIAKAAAFTESERRIVNALLADAKGEVTLSNIANASDAELDVMVDEFLADEGLTKEPIRLPIPEDKVDKLSQEERREDPAKRERVGLLRDHVADMQEKVIRGEAKSDELVTILDQLHTELTTDSLTGLPNENAYREAESMPAAASIDLDSLKWINDHMGHEKGDEMFRKVGEAFRDATGATIYRKGGDEFIAQGQSEEAIQNALQSAQERLANATITVALPNGNQITKTGIEFSFVTGKTYEAADVQLKSEKEARTEAGLRTERGREPTGVVRTPAQGQPDQRSGIATERGLPGTEISDQLIYEPEGTQNAQQEQEKTAETEAEVLTAKDSIKPGELYSNPIAPVYQAYRNLGQKVINRVHNAFGWRFTPLGQLPAQDLYLAERNKALGKIADSDNIAKRIYETFRVLEAKEAELVYQYLTTKEADLTRLSTKPVGYRWKGKKVESTVRKQAETVKKLINRTGENLVKAGLLNRDSHQKYQDAYLPRLYLKHLLGEDALRGFAGGKKPSDMGYLKKRKEIPKDVRELILGEITDPGYLASKSLGRSMRDLAVLDWFEQMAKRPDWAHQDVLVNYQGKKVSLFWLKAEADRIRKQIPYYKPENQAKASEIVKRMDVLVETGIAKLGTVPDHFRQVPDTVQYGRLRGMYIREEIYNDIVGVPGNRDPHAEWWQAPFEYGAVGTKVTQLWKMSKVALNPPTQIRNFISNAILLQLSGVGSHRVVPLMGQAVQEIRQNGKYWRVAKKYGITASTFAQNEIFKIERAFLDLKAKHAGKASLAQLKNIGGMVGETASDIYGLSEAVFKTAKIIDAMKREGKSEADAVLDAQKWLYDYSLVPKSVRYYRNAPIGAPFLTFYYKTLPRMIEVMATAPHRFVPYVAIPAIMTATIAEMYDVDDDDVEKLKTALPDWLKDHGHVFFLPYKDKHGRWQAFDFSYLLPWSMYEQAINNVQEAEPREFVQTIGVLGGPVPDLLSAIKTNKDAFTQKEIMNKNDPAVDQIQSVMNYLWSLSMPTWMTDNGFTGKMYDAVTGKVHKRTGEPKLTVPQAAMRLFGINLYPIEPEASRRRNMRFIQYEIDELARRMGQRLRDKNLTTEDKRDIRKVFRALIKERQVQLKDYRDNSKVHQNLKGDKPNKDARDSAVN